MVGILNQSKKNATVLLSGGIDSTSCVHLLKSQGYSVNGIFIDYGQSSLHHERMAVEKIKDVLEIDLRYISTATSGTKRAGELVGRNAILIFTAIFSAEIQSGLLAIGVHSGTPYYDCTKNFIDQMDKIICEYSNGKLSLVAPFVDWDKPTIYHYFRDTGIPMEMTYSCESGVFPACNQCASCLDRRLFQC